jgi:hypothetical protein
MLYLSYTKLPSMADYDKCTGQGRAANSLHPRGSRGFGINANYKRVQSFAKSSFNLLQSIAILVMLLLQHITSATAAAQQTRENR